MDLKGKTLVDWLSKQENEQFPGGQSYINRYNLLAEFLNKHVHPLVATGAALKNRIFLNDHGPEHIKTVINRASAMVKAKTCKLHPYEAYLLLAAIQIHDIGNITGRDEHERVPEKLYGELETHLGSETIEKRMIFQIARAHGGAVEGDKDTITYLEAEVKLLGQTVRQRFLAALLRFADELADDRTRAARFALDHGVIPDEGVIYHKYSWALHTVDVDVAGRAVDLHFEMSDSDARVKFSKDGTAVHLIDEITRRTLKMHRERLYCMRFMRPMVNLDSVNVKVTVYATPDPELPYAAVLDEIGYRLEDRGYPDSRTDVLDVCPELRTWYNGGPLSGDALIARLDERKKKS